MAFSCLDPPLLKSYSLALLFFLQGVDTLYSPKSVRGLAISLGLFPEGRVSDLSLWGLPTCCCSCLVTKSCPTLCDPMDCSPPGSSVHGIFQTRILEWVVISFSRGSSWSGNWTSIFCMGGGFFTGEPPGKPTPIFLAPGSSFVEVNFFTGPERGDGFRMISSTLHLLCTLFPLLLYQLHHRSSGIRSQRDPCPTSPQPGEAFSCTRGNVILQSCSSYILDEPITICFPYRAEDFRNKAKK